MKIITTQTTTEESNYLVMSNLKEALLCQPDNTACVLDDNGSIVFNITGDNVAMTREFLEILSSCL